MIVIHVNELARVVIEAAKCYISVLMLAHSRGINAMGYPKMPLAKPQTAPAVIRVLIWIVNVYDCCFLAHTSGNRRVY